MILEFLKVKEDNYYFLIKENDILKTKEAIVEFLKVNVCLFPFFFLFKR